MSVAINVAAFARVFGPLVAPQHYLQCVITAGLVWSATYALYAIRYGPVLTQPRAVGASKMLVRHFGSRSPIYRRPEITYYL